MLPIILVVLVATSALAAPGTVNLIQLRENDNRYRDNSLLERAFGVFGGGAVNVNVLNMQENIKDLAKRASGQALAYGQAVALLGELSTGRAGDVCAASNLISEYIRYAESGRTAGVREALKNFVQSLSRRIDSIARLASNREAARFACGVRGGCDGRPYPLNAAWEYIIGNSPGDQINVIRDQYCIVTRLNRDVSASNNNIGALITASALPPTAQLYNQSARALSNLLNSLASNRNVDAAANAAKQALSNALPHIIL